MPDEIVNIKNGDSQRFANALGAIDWPNVKNATFFLRNGTVIRLRKTKKVALSYDRACDSIGLAPIEEPSKQLRKCVSALDVCAFYLKADATDESTPDKE